MEFWFKFYVCCMVTLTWIFTFMTWATGGLHGS